MSDEYMVSEGAVNPAGGGPRGPGDQSMATQGQDYSSLSSFLFWRQFLCPTDPSMGLSRSLSCLCQPILAQPFWLWCHLENGAVVGNQVEVEGEFLMLEAIVEQHTGGDGNAQDSMDLSQQHHGEEAGVLHDCMV